jgi:2-dehydro-3-deoxygalactonokinase
MYHDAVGAPGRNFRYPPWLADDRRADVPIAWWRVRLGEVVNALFLAAEFISSKPMNQAQFQTQLIALDWGTSSLRAYRLGAAGRVIEVRSLPWGVMKLPEVVLPDHSGTDLAARFEFAFEEACGDWIRAAPKAPVIAAGMVGSRQGWSEAPYLPLPIAVDQIGRTLSTVHTRNGHIVHIVPGLIENSALPNVMRGEETQVTGAISLLDFGKTPARAEQNNDADHILIGLPGSHSKWVQVRTQRPEKTSHIEHFHTFMTGEVYAALCGHTILGRAMQTSDIEDDHHAAFDRGVFVPQTPAGRAGVLSTIFSTRTLGLTGELDGAGQHEYLSGLLIGHEVAALKTLLSEQGQKPSRVILVGDGTLCVRYTRALSAYGFDQIEVAAQATERGLWQLAMAAGLMKLI